jgi:hypothetical protein
MKIFIISFIIIGLSLAGMAAGIFLKRGCLKGSCGGLNNFSGADGECPCRGKSGNSPSDKEA